MMSVPAVLGWAASAPAPAAPYLMPDESLVDIWRERLNQWRGFRIAIVWQGNPKHADDRLRSFGLADLRPLSTLGEVRFFSLQKGAGAEQIDQVRGQLEVIDLGPDIDNGSDSFVESAAVLQSMDLLIFADTAVAHLAGVLGVKVWLMLSEVPDWRWRLGVEDTP